MRSAQRGFTLIELLVVVAILAILLVIGTTSMEMLLPDTRLSAAARDLAKTIEDARDQAVLDGRTVWIEYELGEGTKGTQTYRTIREQVPGDERLWEDIEFELELQSWTHLPQGVRLHAILVGEEEPVTDGFFSIPVQSDGSIAPHVVQFRSEEIDAWYSVQIAGLFADAQLYEKAVEPLFLTEDMF